MSPPREHPGPDGAITTDGPRPVRRPWGGLPYDSAPAPVPTHPQPPRPRPAEVSPTDVLGWLEPPRTTRPDPGPAASAPSAPPAAAPTGGPATAILGPPGAGELFGDPGAPTVVRPSGILDRYRARRLGVAPFVRPAARRNRRRRRHDYRRLGFVELTPEPLRLRHRILPRTVIGISLLLTALGAGAAFSGAAFYAYYDWRTGESEARSNAFAEGFEKTFAGAQDQLQSTRNDAVAEIDRRLEPLRAAVADANAVVGLPAAIGDGVFLVRTLDVTGRPSVGTAFVVTSNATESMLLTSYDVVAAAAARPGPAITLDKAGESIPTELWAWDPAKDLALLRVAKGRLPQPAWATESQRSAVVGTRVYALSGLGGQGATTSPGTALDLSAAGIRHDVRYAPEFRGAPLTTADGRVLGVLSTAYSPTGIDPGELRFAPVVSAACERLLRCPDAGSGAAPTAAGRTTATTPANATPTTARRN